ncbi:MAG: hypothetical protein ACKVJU_10320 [Verrucomicrobiales bacterium]
MGEWIVTFTNGIEQTVDIAADGKVTVTEPKRTAKGKAVVKDGVTEIRYDDDRVELWSFGSKKDNLTVQHWLPILARSKTMPAIGSALKNDTKPSALKVHEWGTFTVLQGSSGQVIDWYQAPNKLVDLPPFVKQQRIRLSGKSGTTQNGYRPHGNSGFVFLSRKGNGRYGHRKLFEWPHRRDFSSSSKSQFQRTYNVAWIIVAAEFTGKSEDPEGRRS